MAEYSQISGTPQIPSRALYPTLYMTAQTPVLGNHQTVFVGEVDNVRFTNDKWITEMERMKILFQITDTERCHEMKIRVAADETVNQKQVLDETFKAVAAVNSANVEFLRIVLLGTTRAESLDEFLIFLVDKWNISLENKQVQVIAYGDSEDYLNLRFCKRLCMQKICHSVQYYFTLDYDTYGNFEQIKSLVKPLNIR